MTQPSDITLSNQSGSSYRTEHNSINQGFGTNHKGGSEPSYVVTGMTWIDDTITPWEWKLYDGAASFAFMEVNPSTNNVTLVNVKNGNARTEGASIGQIQDSSTKWAGTSSGTNTVTATLTPAITAYANGQRFAFLAGGTNTGATTLNFNSVGAKVVEKLGVALVAGDLTANDLVLVAYDSTNDAFQLLSPARVPVLNGAVITGQSAGAVALTDNFIYEDGAGSLETDTIQGIVDLVSSAGLVLLATATASASAAIDFTSNIDSTYEEYEIHIIDLVPATDTANLLFRTDSNGGASFDAGASDYRYAVLENSDLPTTIHVSSTGAAFIQLSDSLGNAAGESGNYVITLFNPAGTKKTQINIKGTIVNSGARSASFNGGGYRDSAAIVDAVRFLMSSGNITSGEFKLYGVKKS